MGSSLAIYVLIDVVVCLLCRGGLCGLSGLVFGLLGVCHLVTYDILIQ